MKSKKLLITLLTFFAMATNWAQISFSNAGIAVQGIARNNDNSARISEALSFKFELYAKDNGGESSIFSETVNLTTDVFGVFSHVIEIGFANNPAIANGTAHLRISEGTNIISDEKLNHVPYAISANNGVPTGAIMPYIGTIPPKGWVLCDGGSLTSIEGSEELIALVGNNAPNLQGMFLRGTGRSPVNNQSGPSLRGTQQDEFKSHTHGDTFSIANGGSHSHNIKFDDYKLDNDDNDSRNTHAYHAQGNDETIRTEASGSHSHTINGSIQATGGSETRPVNYGVNYIIKL